MNGTKDFPSMRAGAGRHWTALMAAVTVMLIIATMIARLALGLSAVLGQPISSSAPRLSGTAASCPITARGGQDSVIAWNSPQGDTEYVGYSSSRYVFRNSTYVGEAAPQLLQDDRIQFDQQQIFQQNCKVDQAQRGAGRTVVELVYFAGLTEGPGEQYDSGEAEELEGLLAAQRNAFNDPGLPYLKIVVANGGSKMQAAARVAQMLIPLFRQQRDLLGVVGLDRSIKQVQQAIHVFEASKIPVVATTLSADAIAGSSNDPLYRYYFQLSASNKQEAHLVLQYIQQIVPHYFEQPHILYPSGGHATPTRIVIYQPSADSNDLYISSLVSDLQEEAPGFSGIPPLTFTDQLGPPLSLCGNSSVDIYAGRHDRPLAAQSQNDDFTQFLQTIESCPATAKPFIIADDGVSRFVADPAARAEPLGDVSVSYVTKGVAIMQTGAKCLNAATDIQVPPQQRLFCQAYATIVSQLLSQPGLRGHQFTLWTGDRVGLAYDAARLFLEAVRHYQDQDGSKPITRTQIPGQFESGTYSGVTGTVSFTATSHTGADTPQGMPLAVVRIHLSLPSAMPTCQYLSQDGQLFGGGPNPGRCPDGTN